MNNNQFEQKITSTLDKTSADKYGFVTGKYRLQQTSGGNVTRRFADQSVKAFIDRTRRDMLQNGSAIGFVELCESFAKMKTIDDLFVFTYRKIDGSTVKITFDNKQRQQRIAAFSTRIKKAFAPMFGVSDDAIKDMNLSGEQILRIVQASGKFYARNTQKYVKVVKAEKPVEKTAKPRKPVNAKKLRQVVANAAV
jgi:hypothetical protein